MEQLEGGLSATGMKLAVFASRFNSFLVEQLVKGAVDAFTRMGGADGDLVLVRVPGAYEEPAAIKSFLAKRKVDAVVALGVVVQGATPHASLINETTARAFSQISLDSGIPVIDGIVSADTLEQAVERCGTKQGNKGFSAVQSAVEMVNVIKKF